MRFKIDENLPVDVADRLRAIGHDAMTVAEQGMRGKVDSILGEVCKDEKRALVTLDLDFANIREYPPQDYPGLVVIRVADQSRKKVLEVFEKVISNLESAQLAGALWIVEESRIRVRGPEANP